MELNIQSTTRKPELTEDDLELGGVIPRYKDGRPKIWLPDGSKRAAYSRPSNLGEVLEDKRSLQSWSERAIMAGILQDPSLLDRFKSIYDAHEAGTMDDNQFKTAASRIVENAKDLAGTSVKAEIGTALHEITEMIDQGIDPGFIPPEHEATIEAYVKAMKIAKDKHGLVVLGNEEFIVNDEWKVAGTLDKLLLWEDLPIIGDTKSSQTLTYSRGKFTMQVGAYARGKRYDTQLALAGKDDYGVGVGRYPLYEREVSREWGVIIHMPSGGNTCDIVKVPLDRAQVGYDLGNDVREWRNSWNRKGSEFESIISVEV